MGDKMDEAARISEESKWLLFEEMTNCTGRKTKTWLVTSKVGGDILGEVRWFGRWRQYAFYPRPNTIFAGSCFTDLAAFCQAVRRVRVA